MERKNENPTTTDDLSKANNGKEGQANETSHSTEGTKRKELTLGPPEGWSDEARKVRDEDPD